MDSGAHEGMEVEKKALEMEDEHNAEKATPYPHQVGGHGQLAVTNNGHLLKPLLDKEHQFYLYIHNENLPEELKWIRQVTPGFYGETKYPNIQSPFPIHIKNNRNKRIPLLWSSTNDNPIPTPHISPWAAQVCLRDSSSSSSVPPQHQPAIRNRKNRPSRSIALEDLTHNFTLPCVLDCKLGTRQYDDDATPEKRRRHIHKANRTTSAKCGIRCTGMQSFKRTSEMFEARDKYRGRTLSECDLIPEFEWFFSDGHVIRIDCVIGILERLAELRRFHLGQSHFFFYSSSLLLVYEGCVDAVKVDVRMIDFAHTVLSNGKRDNGYLKGINYLIHILSMVVRRASSSSI